MVEISKNAGWEIMKKSFYPLALLLVFIASFVHYKVNIAPMISPELHQDLKSISGLYLLSAWFLLFRELQMGS